MLNKEIKVLRISCLPTPDFPASGLTSHMIAKGSSDLLAIPFPRELCLFEYGNLELVSDLRIDLRDKKNYKFIRLLLSIYYSFTLSRIAINNAVDVVHVHWIPLIFIRLFIRKKNIKFVLTIHGEDARYLQYLPFRFVVKRFTKVYVVGSYWTSFLLKKGFNVEEIPNFSPIEKEIKDNLQNSKTHRNDLPSKQLCVVASDKSHKNLKIFKEMPKEFFEHLKLSKLSLNIVGVSKNYFLKIMEVEDIPDGIILSGRQSRLNTLSIINKSDLLLIPSFTEGNPKVVWESVELKTFPIISNTLNFLGYNHEQYPFKFNPDNADNFWKIIKEAILKKDKLKLDNYFKISSYNSVRQEYNKIYTKN